MSHAHRPALRRVVISVLICTLAGLLASCAGRTESQKGSQVFAASKEAGGFEHFSGEFTNTEAMRARQPSVVAVLPFTETAEVASGYRLESEDPAVIVRRAFYNHFASLPYSDVELHVVDGALANAGLRDPEAAAGLVASDPAKLKKILGADAVITGRVTHFDRVYAGLYSQVAVGCELSLTDLNSGKLLWRATHVSRAHEGGISLSPISLAMTAASTVWNLSENSMMSETDQLFREVVGTVYVPEGLTAGRPAKPRIDLFAVKNPGGPFRAGQEVSFRLIGDPGCKATVSLPGVADGIELKPVEPKLKAAMQNLVVGNVVASYAKTDQQITPEMKQAIAEEMAGREIYEGSYVVEPGVEGYGLVPRAVLVSPAGGAAERLNPVQALDVDAVPPAPPSGLAVNSLDGSVRLSWKASKEKDIAGYRVFASPKPLSGYAPVLSVETTEAAIPELQNFATFFVTVTARDKAGNESTPCSPLEAVALPEPGILSLPRPGPALSGTLAGTALLTPEKSPYTVGATLTVPKGARLIIAPGVALQFAPGAGLDVEGELLVYGHPDTPVRFVPAATGAPAGSWQGISLSGAARALLTGIIVEQAVNGISVADCAPIIQAARVSGSSQAGLLVQAGGKPEVVCTTFSGNQGQGALVVSGQGADPKLHDNVFSGNDFIVQSFIPLRLDLTQNNFGTDATDPAKVVGDVAWQPGLSAPPVFCRMP